MIVSGRKFIIRFARSMGAKRLFLGPKGLCFYITNVFFTFASVEKLTLSTTELLDSHYLI